MSRRRAPSGQATVESALALGILLLLVVGIVGGAWLVFQYEAVTNAARAGVRAALVETSLLQSSVSGICESGSPESIVQAVQTGATAVAVNPAPLCQSPGNPDQLVQAPGPPGDASITVTGNPVLSTVPGNLITVTVALPVTPLPPFPQAQVVLTADATQPTQ